MNTGEIILNIALGVCTTAVVAGGGWFAANHDRIGFVQRFRSVALEGMAQGHASSRVAVAGSSDDQRESADLEGQLSLAE